MLTTPILIVIIVLASAIFPSYFQLRKETGGITLAGFVFLLVVAASGWFAYENEMSARVENEKNAAFIASVMARFEVLSSRVSEQPKVMDLGEIGIEVTTECVFSLKSCRTPPSSFDLYSQGLIRFDDSLRLFETRKVTDRGPVRNIHLYGGRPYFFSMNEELFTVDDLIGSSLKVSFTLPKKQRVNHVVAFAKGYKFRGEPVEKKGVCGGRVRHIWNLEFDSMFAGVSNGANE